MVCKICNKKYADINGLAIHLSKSHKYDHNMLKDYYDKYLKKDNEGKCCFCGSDAIFKNLSKGYHNICDSKDCLGKTRATGTYQFYMYKYNLSEEDAKIKQSEIALNRGEKIKNGLDKCLENNSLFHKEKSHQSKDYWLKRGLTEEEAILKAKEIMCDIHTKTFKKFKDNPDQYVGVYPTQLEYWLKKGLKIKDARIKLKERQTTFLLDICVEKYGEIEGLNRWLDRQLKWSTNYKKVIFQK